MAVPVIAGINSTIMGGITTEAVTIDKPANVASGDCLLFIPMNEDSTDPDSFAIPTGWSEEFQVGWSFPDVKAALFSRIADGTEGASETSDVLTGLDYAIGWYLRITGAHPTNPVHVVGPGSATSNSTTRTAASITTTVDDCIAFALIVGDGGDTYPFTASGVGWPGSIPSAQHLQATPNSNSVAGCWLTKEIPTAGPTEDCTFTSSVSDGLLAVQFAIAPDPAGEGLVIQDLGIAIATENILLTGEGNLTVQDMAIAIATDNVQLTAESDLVVQGMAMAVGTENVTLGGGGDLTVQHLGISVSTENLDLTGEGNLAVQDLGIALATENITLTAAVLLDVQDLGVGISTENLTLTGSGFLVVQDLGISVGTENVTLAGAADLVVQDLAIGLAAENIELTAEGVLTVQDMAIATAVENIVLGASGSLDVDPLGIGVVVDVVTLAAQSSLSVQDLGIALGLENIELYDGFIAIPVNPTVSAVPITKTVSIVPVRRTVKLEN